MKRFIYIFVVAIVLTNCNSPSKDKIVENNVSTDTLDITGHWTERTKTVIYDFYSDGTWKSTHTELDKIYYTKGKYLIGDEGEVFLRCFGSQHWPNNADTTEDIKTSIGARVLFFKNGRLIDDQEDYSLIFYKH